jgi:hypothetical protein
MHYTHLKGIDMTERFSASVAGRHMACHASANLDLALAGWVPPVEDRSADNAANRGTNMHEIFAKVMELPAKDQRALASAINYVADLRSTRRFKVLIEQPVTVEWLQSTPSTTMDLVLYTQDELHVLDLKTGKIEVDVVDNEQLLYGAVTYAPLAPKAKGATLHILQPWAGGNHSWFADTTRLAQFMDEAIYAEKQILAGSTQFGPGDHCKFCPANPHSRGAKGNIMCPAMMKIHYPGVVDDDAILSL